jgi:hypothetical protein
MADAMAPIFPGWNVWGVWQAKDLPFNPFMVGVSRDRQLRIWVEDHVRTEAGGVDASDPLALKGSQVQILPGRPELQTFKTKEEPPGDSVPLLPSGSDPELRWVRFWNDGTRGLIVWPGDEEYLLDAILDPKGDDPTVKGPPPPRVIESTGVQQGAEVVKDIAIGTALAVGLLALTIGFALRSK